MLSSHFFMNAPECDETCDKILNVNKITKSDVVKCSDVVSGGEITTQYSKILYSSSRTSLLEASNSFDNKPTSFKQSTSLDYFDGVGFPLMKTEMPPVRRKGYSRASNCIQNRLVSSSSLPNLLQNESAHVSVNCKTIPRTSDCRDAVEICFKDDSNDSGLSSRSSTPINNLFVSPGAAGDQGLLDENFIKKTGKLVKSFSNNAGSRNSKIDNVLLSGLQHYSHKLNQQGHINDQPQMNQRFNQYRGSHNYHSFANKTNSGHGSSGSYHSKKKFHQSNRNFRSPERGGPNVSNLMVQSSPTTYMSPVSSVSHPIMNISLLTSMMYSQLPTPPDRFLAKSHLIQITKTPHQLTTGSQWDELSKAVWNKFLTNQQTEETYRKKLELWKSLYILIKHHFPRYNLYVVGSTLSGFGSNTSDVDMCLIVRRQEMDQRSEALHHLTNILFHLHRFGVVDKMELVQAKVPILKFRQRNQGIDVDLNCNNAVGIRNTHLLACYSKLDWRVRPLVLVVKLWAQWHDINDAKHMTISSYSLALMVIHFLQIGVYPPVLPCLHTEHQNKFSAQRDISNIDLLEEIEFKSENNQTLGELLLLFFSYYDNFDFSKYAVSVRLAAKIPVEDCRKVRSIKNEPHQWKYLCVEEPFDLTNTARSVFDLKAFERIRSIIQETHCCLKETHSLNSIFHLKKPLYQKNPYNYQQHPEAQHRSNTSHQQHLNGRGWINQHQRSQSAHSNLNFSEKGSSHLFQRPSTSSQTQIHNQSYIKK